MKICTPPRGKEGMNNEIFFKRWSLLIEKKKEG